MSERQVTPQARIRSMSEYKFKQKLNKSER